MNQLCRVYILKDSCPGSDSPILNYSAEDPEQLFFFGTMYNRWNPWRPSPLGAGVFVVKDCAGVVYSTISQEEASLLALNSSDLCTQGGQNPPADPVTPGNPTGPDTIPIITNPTPNPGNFLVSNSPQTATGGCSSFATFSFTCPAGTFSEWMTIGGSFVVGCFSGVGPLPSESYTFTLSNDPTMGIVASAPRAGPHCDAIPTGPVSFFGNWGVSLAGYHVPLAAVPSYVTSAIAAQNRVNAKALAFAQQRVAHYDYCVTQTDRMNNVGMCLNQPYASDPSPLFSLTNSSGHVHWTASGLPPGISLKQGNEVSVTDPQFNQWILVSGGRWMNLTTLAVQNTQPAGVSSGTVGTADLIGTPTQRGTFPFHVTATDVAAGTSATFTGTIKVMGFINSNPLPNGYECSVYNEPLGADGGEPDYTYSVDPTSSLPTGLSITNNILTGQVAVGTYSFKLIVRDSTGRTCSQDFTLSVTPAPAISITTATPLPNAHLIPGAAYGYLYTQALAATGGCPFPPEVSSTPYVWTLESGSLPSGITLGYYLSGQGVIQGYPNAGTVGTYNFTLRVTDSAAHTTTKAFTLTVDTDEQVVGSCVNNPANIAIGLAHQVNSYPPPTYRATANAETTHANAIDNLIANLQTNGCNCPPCSVQVDPSGNQTTITNTSSSCNVIISQSGDSGGPFTLTPGQVFNYWAYHWLAFGGPPGNHVVTFDVGGGVSMPIRYDGT